MAAAVLAAVSALGACNPLPAFDDRASGFVEGFRGGVAGDEPQAVLAARQILAEGGTAADAIVGAYFTMSATLPSSASLGGGGLCYVLDSATEHAEFLDFRHAGPAPVPGNIRGMLALQGKYGVLAWPRLVADGENAARFGTVVSRAFAQELQSQGADLLADPEMRRVFGEGNGTLREGSSLHQPALADTLREIRQSPTRFLSARGASRLAADYRAAGIDIDAQEILSFKPRWQTPLVVRAGNERADFPPTPAGAVQAQTWAMLYRGDAWRRAEQMEGGAEAKRVLAEVSRRAYSDAGRYFRAPDQLGGALPELLSEKRIANLMDGIGTAKPGPLPDFLSPPSPLPVAQGSATIVAVDRFGQSVACAFTMNGTMGAQRMAPRTGIVIAGPRNVSERGTPPLAIMALRLESQNQLLFIGAGSKGPGAGLALADVALRAFGGDETLEQAMDTPRLLGAPGSGRIIVEEPLAASEIAADLRKMGYSVESVSAIGRLNGISCPAGFEGSASRCEVRSDRRGFGMAARY